MTINSVDLGNFDAPQGGEVCVDIESGEFHTRTSYKRENNRKVLINEKIVIDLDNDASKSVSFNVKMIPVSDLDQFSKDNVESEILGNNEVDYSAWNSVKKLSNITVFDGDNETDIVINTEAYVVHEKPDQGEY